MEKELTNLSIGFGISKKVFTWTLTWLDRFCMILMCYEI